MLLKGVVDFFLGLILFMGCRQTCVHASFLKEREREREREREGEGERKREEEGEGERKGEGEG